MTYDQTSIFDNLLGDTFDAELDTLTARARRDRDAGMEQTDDAAPDLWKTYADRYIVAYLVTHRTLFVDELWSAGLIEPPSPRALGPRMMAAVRAGYMRRSGRSAPSVRSRMGHKPIWESLIYGETWRLKAPQ